MLKITSWYKSEILFTLELIQVFDLNSRKSVQLCILYYYNINYKISTARPM